MLYNFYENILSVFEWEHNNIKFIVLVPKLKKTTKYLENISFQYIIEKFLEG